ncbi:synaptonemal complex protein 2 isoform X2 [Clupea harengus]|uniref:Synaptonemal complex protein 2 isoform X2 n=1 Tax=Clupea harengus TaxID=7950 RepID=A0A6P8FGS1_CLUHA|nr:synaptonemal complex protein 2 isoform X2 [Clupea harengus]
MAPLQDQQIEKLLDEALKQSRFQALEDFLNDKTNEGTPSKCSKLFITKLDKFMSRELDQKHVKNACLGLKILHTFGCCLVSPGGEGLAGMVSQGILEKMKQWFEKAWHLWMEGGTKANEMLLHLAEDFFDALMAIHDSGKEGTYQVSGSFLALIGKLASDSQVHISVQKEAVQKLNVILDAMPPELKKERKILSKESSNVIKELAGCIVDGGDYDLQAAMLESIYRMTVASQRREFVHNWFTMDFVASAFLKIREPQFETDCRKFLNMANGMKGDVRRVYSYPCLGVFLDKHELLMPSDEKLEEFWIDFNLGSLSVSFYCTLASDEAQEPSSTWETFFLPNNEVESFSVDEQGDKKALSVMLTSPRSLGAISGSRLSIHFSPSLDILQAAQKVFGSAKGKRFVRKKGTSVVKTTVQIILDETNSQVIIPDSQIPLRQRSERQPPALNTSTSRKASPPAVPVENSIPKSVTLARPKISMSSTIISSSGRKLGESPRSAVLSTPRGKVKPALQMVSSVDRKCELNLKELVVAKTSSSMKYHRELLDTSREQQSVPAPVRPRSAEPRPDPKRGHEAEKFRRHIPVAKVLEMVQAEEPLDESIVPDSQPPNRKESSMRSGLWSGDVSKKKRSVCESVASGRSNSSQGARNPDPALKPTPSVEQQPQQWRPPSAQNRSREVSQRDLHSQITQKLEAVVRDREQGTPAKEALTAGSSRSQTPSGGLGKAKAVPVKMPNPNSLKPTPIKALSEKTANTKVSPSDTKEKPARGSAARGKKSEEVTDSMLKFISSHFQGKGCVTTKDSGPRLAGVSNKRSLFDKSWSLGVKGDSNGSGFLKSFEMSKKADVNEDVYAFNTKTPSSTGKIFKKASEKSVMESSAISSSFALSASAKKAPPDRVFSRHLRKHLFSDTDTDRDKENTTDVSWLRDSARRAKPKVADYSRQPAKPCPPPCTSDVSPDLPALSPELLKERAKPKRKRPQKKPVQQKPVEPKPVEQKAAAKPSVVATGTSRRPRRAVAVDVSYREASDHSETEEPPALPTKKRRTADPPDMTERPAPPEVKKMKKVSPPPEVKKTKKVSPPPEVKKMKKVSPPPEKPVKPPLDSWAVKPPQDSWAVKPPLDSWASRLASSHFSPPSMEHMRSAARSPPLALSPTTPLLHLCLSPVARPSPPPTLEMPKPMIGIQASSFYKPAAGGKDKLKTPSLPVPPTPNSGTPRMASCRRSCASENLQLSPVHSLHSPAQPLLTSTGLEKSPEGSPLKSIDLDQQLRDFIKAHETDKDSVISMVTLSQSSHLSVNNVAILCTEIEKTPASSRGRENGKQTLHSGPSYHRTCHPSQSDRSHTDIEREDEDDEEEEEEDVRGAPREKALKMKPRKLFKEKEKGPRYHRTHQPSQSDRSHTDIEKEDEEEEEEDVRGAPREKALKKKPRKLFKEKEKAAWLKQPEEKQSSSEQDEENEQEEEQEEEQEALQSIRGKKSRRAVQTTKKSYYTKQTDGTGTVENMEVEMSSHMVASASSSWKTGLQGDVDPDAVHTEISTSQEMGYVCREFSTELTRKFQKRTEKMELYTKQSLKSVQQHMSSVSLRMSKNRMQRMEKVKTTLMEEIGNLEQDNSALKSMEKELTIYWKKQSLAFHSYQNRESRRLQHLKNSFQTNVCPSLEYEEQIFSSEMVLMKKDMKSVQDKFLQEMREEELSSMRRGLQTLFLSGTPMF